MTDSIKAKNTTAPIVSEPTPFDIAFGAAIKAQDESERVNMTFMGTLEALRALGVNKASLQGKHGKTIEGKYFDPARRVIARNMDFTPDDFALLFDADDRMRDSKTNAFTPRGLLNNRVTKRLGTLRDRIAKEDANALKAETAGKSGVSTGGAKPKANNGAETDLKIALDRAAVAKKLMGEAKTEAQTQAKALRVDVQAVHAAWVQLADTLIAIHGKHGGGKN